MSDTHSWSRREFMRIGSRGIIGTVLVPNIPAINAAVPVSGVVVEDVKFTADLSKVTVHKFKDKCALQLGNPERGTVGIKFKGEVRLRAVVIGGQKPDYGTLQMLQNVKFDWRRTPPSQPDPLKKRFHECAGSGGSWAVDKPVSPLLALHREGIHVIYGEDSPGVWLEEAPNVFEDVTAKCEFRTFLVHTTHGAPHVLARIMWSWNGRAISTGARQGDCVSKTLPIGWVRKSGDQQVSPAEYGPAASTPAPVNAPQAEPDKWVLC